MTTVDLRTVWLNSASDLSDVQHFPAMSTLTVAKALRGDVKRMAGGKFRLFTRQGTQRMITADLPYCEREQIAWLEEHVGRLVCARDDRGRKIYGVYATVSITEHRATSTTAHCSVAIVEVTHFEGE